MNREIYKRVAPHLDRIKQDGGAPTDNMSDLFLLQRSNEQYKDYLKLSFCPELHGYKKDTRSNVDYITKGYSVNNIQQELGPNLVVNGGFDTNSNWNVGVDGILTITNGTASINNNGSGRCRFRQLLSTISGKKYRITFTIHRVDRSISFVTSPYSGLMSETNYITYNSTGIKSYDFIATASNSYIGFLDDNQSTINATTIIDNVSLQEVLSNDLTQKSSANQPYLDKIAPAEKLSAKNPNGGGNYLTHPTISFGASDEWTVEVVLNSNASNLRDEIFGCYDGDKSSLGLSQSNYFIFKFESDNFIVSFFGSSAKIFGKNSILHLVGKNNVLALYLNGTLIEQKANVTNSTTITLKTLLCGYSGSKFNGFIYSYHIFSKALSASEVAERSAILRSIFPEIPFTRIGDQIWSVRNFEAAVTPQGNLIPEMQANGNVEKITNGGFDTDTGWDTTGVWTISGGVASVVNSSLNINNIGFAVKANTWYKVTYTIVNFNGNGFVAEIGGSIGINRTSPGTYTEFIKTVSINGFYLYGANFTGSIDNVSVQEIGWEGSQDLYTGIFNQRKTLGDTDEQATYAAVKAAAMWCHYGNNVTLGAIYGKLYNWFAVKLLQMDIDYYNANNPTTPWGWRVPTQSDFNTLATTLGGAAVAGGKMKTVGNTYWDSPNTGADNSSGFSVIGSGRRTNKGSYQLRNYITKFLSLTANSGIGVNRNDATCEFLIDSNVWGYSLRLIKS